jgi:hypothetical protein
MSNIKKVKRLPPTFWWDFESPNGDFIIVECDYDEYPIVGRFEANDVGIEKAENLIHALKNGRENPKQLAKELKCNL